MTCCCVNVVITILGLKNLFLSLSKGTSKTYSKVEPHIGPVGQTHSQPELTTQYIPYPKLLLDLDSIELTYLLTQNMQN